MWTREGGGQKSRKNADIISGSSLSLWLTGAEKGTSSDSVYYIIPGSMTFFVVCIHCRDSPTPGGMIKAPIVKYNFARFCYGEGGKNEALGSGKKGVVVTRPTPLSAPHSLVRPSLVRCTG